MLLQATLHQHNYNVTGIKLNCARFHHPRRLERRKCMHKKPTIHTQDRMPRTKTPPLMHIHVQTSTHAYTYARTHARKHTHMLIHTYTYTHAHANTHIHTHTNTPIHIQTHTRIHETWGISGGGKVDEGKATMQTWKVTFMHQNTTHVTARQATVYWWWNSVHTRCCLEQHT
jgi:hypothetical protein